MGSDERTLPMFPLGSTVFPGQLVPLHVFEDRYRQLLTDLTAPGADATFGTVLIDRGHEVGGGDHRMAIGTRMQVLQAEEFDDGRWGLVAAGSERLEVVRWLDDDPYPRAIVTPRVVRDTGGGLLESLEETLFETLALLVPTHESERPQLSDDPLTRLDQLAALAPLAQYDRQRLLEATTTTELIRLLDEALVERQSILGAQLGES